MCLSGKGAIKHLAGPLPDAPTNPVRPLSGAEDYLLKRLHGLGASTGDGYLDPEEVARRIAATYRLLRQQS